MNLPAEPTMLPAVDTLLPHAAPMILIDRLLDVGDRFAVAAVEVRPGSPFVDDGQVAALVTIEYMAQTIGAMVGYQARRGGRAPQIGFLIACRSFEAAVPSLAVGTWLRVEIRHVWGEAALGSFECDVCEQDGERVAQATLSVANPPPEVIAALCGTPAGVEP